MLVEREIDALADAGLIDRPGPRIEASEAGSAAAAIFLGLKGSLPRAWDEVREVRLVAKALGLEREAGKRLSGAGDARRAACGDLQKAFGLKIKGVATPRALRTGLAAVALARAFGNQFKARPAGKLGLSAKAGPAARRAARARSRAISAPTAASSPHSPPSTWAPPGPD